MPTLNRLHGAFIASVLVAGTSAYAGPNDAPNDPAAPQAAGGDNLTDPPNTCENETAQCPAPTPPAPVAQAPAPAPMPMPAEEPPHEMWYQRIGVGLAVGGGGGDFVGDDLRNTTGTAGNWEVRATFGTKQYLAGEVSYIGSAQSIDAIGLSNNADLIGNGVQGALRINVVRAYPIQPFLFIGAAWRHYDLTNTNFNVSDVQDSSDVFEMPFGVGFAGYYRGFMLDVRGTYRGAWGDNLIPDNDLVDQNTLLGDMDRWDATGSIGMEF